jgi:hypothetical protein
MKKLILAVFLSLLLAVAPVWATTYYVDLDNGDDGTGDGSAGNPYATVDQCIAAGANTGGDECRVAKTAVNALSGTLTFTNGSTTISTSQDLSGVLADGSVIGKDSGNESWWSVASCTSDTITLDYQYWGTSETTSAYYLTMRTVASDDEMRVDSSGTSWSSMLKISGGWDLGTTTQDGVTSLDLSGGYKFFATSAEDYVEFSNFIIYSNNVSASISGSSYYRNTIVKDIDLVSPYVLYSGDYLTLDNVKITGGATVGISVNNSGAFPTLKNIYIYSVGDGTTDYGIGVENTFCLVENINIYNSYATALYVSTGGYVVGKNITIDTTRYSSSDGISLSYSAIIDFNNVSISNTSDDGIALDVGVGRKSIIRDITFSSIGDDEVFAYASTSNFGPVLTIEDYGGTSNDDRMFFASASGAEFARIVRDTTDARSGSCLKFDVDDADGPIRYTLGTYKIVSAASDLTLQIYMKDDSSFNGEVTLWAEQEGKVVVFPEVQSLTTSYAQKSVVVDSSDLVVGEYVNLIISVASSAGSVFVDDFSVSQ